VRVTDSIRIYWALQRAALRGQLQYRLNFVLGLVTGFAYWGRGFAFLMVVLARFPSVDGWTFNEITFLYGMRLLAHAIFIVPFNCIPWFDQMSRDGDFDLFLTRPFNPLAQALTRRTYLAPLGDLILGAGLFLFALARVDVHWTLPIVLFTIAAVIGGGCAEAAVNLMLVGAFSLRAAESFSYRILLDNIFGTFGPYPVRIFGGIAEWLLTVPIPVAFVAYFPGALILGKTGMLFVPVWVAAVSPLVGIWWLAAAYLLVWRRQLRRYQELGN
jgi:ABC-2 type transport system permease protein